jgi:hypothetical protein
MIILSAVLATFVLGSAIVLLLRITIASRLKLSEGMDLSWRDYRPLHRLLDPVDFDYLRRRGVNEARIQKLRVDRRKIYRMCLRSLARDFNQVHAALNMLIVQSREDRSALAAELAKQRFVFYRNLLLLEFRLNLHACGFERVPAINLLQPMEILQAQLRQMALAGAAA